VFIERDVANSGNTAARQRDPRLSLRIGVHPAESTPFEPIHLDITIKPARTHEGTPIRLPRMLDPAHQSFRIYIRDPRGNTWRYRNTTHCCPSARTIQITRERPFRRDIVVMAEQGRYTFRDPGIYRLHVEYDVGKRHTLRSNTAEVLVRAESPRDRQWRSTLGVLKSPAAVQLLQYRRTHSARLLDRMALMIDAWKGPWDERKSLIAYRWARAVIDSRWTQRMERKTATALRYLDKCRYLQSHREARVAEMMAAPGAGARTA
jgi:hypothetical protein